MAVSVSPDVVADANGAVADQPRDPRAAAMLELVNRAEAVSQTLSADGDTRRLIADLTVALVAAYTNVCALESRLAETPRIVTP